MWLFILSLFVVVKFGESSENFVNFGNFICPREDNAMGRCLRDVLNTYLPHIATGVPKYAIPPCEPLYIPSLQIIKTAGPVSAVAYYTDVIVRGPSKMRVKDIEVQSAERKIIATLYIPELRMKGNYKLKGQILMLPIEGDGQFSAKYGEIDALVTIILGKVQREDGTDALTCESLDVKFHAGYASIHLENLFGGDEELGNAMNKFLNDNWQQLSEEMHGPMEEALRDVLKPLANHAFGTLDADEFLSVSEHTSKES